jgi:hypothetical protein
MRRIMLWLLMCLVAAGIVGVYPLHATVPGSVRKALKERFRLSHVVVESELIEGRVFNPSTILILQTDGVPAKKFRVIQHLPKWPRFHGRDYAPVIIDADGRLTADPGDYTLVRGTRLVVLDLRFKADRIHLFTHMLNPPRLADGKAVSGCTEFIFPFEAGSSSGSRLPQRSKAAKFRAHT